MCPIARREQVAMPILHEIVFEVHLPLIEIKLIVVPGICCDIAKKISA
jgi:hypothetical protein